MKLIYSLEDNLFWIQNFLSNDFYRTLHKSLIKERKLINSATNVSWKQTNNSNSMYEFNENLILKYEILLNLIIYI